MRKFSSFIGSCLIFTAIAAVTTLTLVGAEVVTKQEVVEKLEALYNLANDTVTNHIEISTPSKQVTSTPDKLTLDSPEVKRSLLNYTQEATRVTVISKTQPLTHSVGRYFHPNRGRSRRVYVSNDYKTPNGEPVYYVPYPGTLCMMGQDVQGPGSVRIITEKEIGGCQRMATNLLLALKDQGRI